MQCALDRVTGGRSTDGYKVDLGAGVGQWPGTLRQRWTQSLTAGPGCSAGPHRMWHRNTGVCSLLESFHPGHLSGTFQVWPDVGWKQTAKLHAVWQKELPSCILSGESATQPTRREQQLLRLQVGQHCLAADYWPGTWPGGWESVGPARLNPGSSCYCSAYWFLCV
jgi:hypothetical protein